MGGVVEVGNKQKQRTSSQEVKSVQANTQWKIGSQLLFCIIITIQMVNARVKCLLNPA